LGIGFSGFFSSSSDESFLKKVAGASFLGGSFKATF
jgi:hypothetical protein